MDNTNQESRKTMRKAKYARTENPQVGQEAKLIKDHFPAEYFKGKYKFYLTGWAVVEVVGGLVVKLHHTEDNRNYSALIESVLFR